MQTPVSATFWKSPYSGDAVWRNPVKSSTSRNTSIRSDLDVIRSRLKTTLPPAEIKPVYVRSILKNPGVGTCGENSDGPDTARSGISESGLKPISAGKLRLITTGTGKGEPHLSKPRAKTSTKSVKFRGLSSTQTFLNDKLKTLTSSTNTKGGNRHQTPRMLGSFNYASAGLQAAVQGHGGSNVALADTLKEESQIKYQITDIVKRLRQVKHEQLSNEYPSGDRSAEKQPRQSRTADILRGTSGRRKQNYSSKQFFDWADYDLEMTQFMRNQHQNVEEQNLQIETKIVQEYNKSRDEQSESVVSLDSLESFLMNSEQNVVEETPGGAKVVRPRPNASLYTRYRHITGNKMDRYSCSSASMRKYDRLQSNTMTGDCVSSNFCDKNKASRIMDWLADVNNAQSESRGHRK